MKSAKFLRDSWRSGGLNMGDTRPSAIDLFSGCGGLSLGLRLAGYRVVAAVEIDRKAAQTYRLNHPDVVLMEQDITRLEPRELMERCGIRPGQLNLLAGCPPCQGFSRIRTRNGSSSNADPRNNLAMSFLDFAVALKPRHLLLENVPGLRAQPLWTKLKRELSAAGYRLVEDVVDAHDFGVPQRRKRLLLLGTFGRQPNVPARCDNRLTVGDALAHVPEDDELHRLRVNHSEAALRIIRAIPKNGGSRGQLPDMLKLACHGKTNGFSDVYGRMSWDRPAPTITSGCHNPSKGRFLHPFEDRAISLREAALLQGFPPDYQFVLEHGKESIALMIGNALPPPMIRIHAEALVSST
ncbi:DNA cytosine methyltransferase [Thermomonas sp. LB-4]|uniref:DNA cytosine methyltransferase n=1 Tax=Thermomonas sp. LB-4 TaxID=3102790 RepID=UPI002ED7AE25